MFCVIPGLPIIPLAGRGCGCGRRWVCPRTGLHVMWFDRRIPTSPEFNGFTIIIFITYALTRNLTAVMNMMGKLNDMNARFPIHSLINECLRDCKAI